MLLRLLLTLQILLTLHTTILLTLLFTLHILLRLLLTLHTTILLTLQATILLRHLSLYTQRFCFVYCHSTDTASSTVHSTDTASSTVYSTDSASSTVYSTDNDPAYSTVTLHTTILLTLHTTILLRLLLTLHFVYCSLYTQRFCFVYCSLYTSFTASFTAYSTHTASFTVQSTPPFTCSPFTHLSHFFTLLSPCGAKKRQKEPFFTTFYTDPSQHYHSFIQLSPTLLHHARFLTLSSALFYALDMTHRTIS